jgi:alpha-L-fucosidase
MTCVKCMAEEALGISTIEGLGKHSAHKIMGAFGENSSIDEAINRLETKPDYTYKPESWINFSQKEYEKHIPRWEAERLAALKWLKTYKEEHGF